MKIAVVGRKNGQAVASHSNLTAIINGFVKVAHARGHRVLVDDDTYRHFIADPKKFHTTWSLDGEDVEQGKLDSADVGVIFGGDGTMLVNAKDLSKHDIPLLGVNLGRLGFITDVPVTLEHEKIIDLLESESYTIEARSMLSMLQGRQTALNEVTISRSTGRILEFQVSIDGEFAYLARGDGLLISTPTGSTAYALSAGGPIIHPTAKVFEVVPMFPQTLSCRPLVINDTSTVRFELVKGDAKVYSDGSEVDQITDGAVLYVEKSKHSVKIIHPQTPEATYNYYFTLREKLNWQRLPGQR